MTKKLTTVAILLSSLIAGSAMAAYTGPGVAAKVTDAKTAQQASDNTPVEMTGFIVKNLGNENYVFRDNKGDEVNVEIDDSLWQGINANETTPVLVIGEVDSDWNSQEVEVSAISLAPVQQPTMAPVVASNSKK